MSRIISLIDDSEMEGVFRDSFLERVSSGDPLEAMPSGKTAKGEDPIKRMMPPSVLTKGEIEDIRLRSEHAN